MGTLAANPPARTAPRGDPALELLRDLTAIAEQMNAATERAEQALGGAADRAAERVAMNAAAALPRAVDRLVRQRWWRASLIAGAALFVVFGLGFGAAEWRHSGDQIVAGVTGGTPRCDDRADGSRLCWIPVWERVARSQ